MIRSAAGKAMVVWAGRTAAFYAMALGMLTALVLVAVAGTRPAEATFPGKNGKIAFASNRVTPDNPTGDMEIFSANPDGTGVMQLTFNTTDDHDPSYSGVGNKIAYRGVEDTDYEIFTIPASGGARTRVTDNAFYDYAPTYSADGTRIAYQGYDGSDWEIYTVPASGGASINVTDNATDDYAPTYSPTGKRIAYQGFDGLDMEIYTISASGGLPRNVTNNGDHEYAPSYSPDGTRIAYEGFDGQNNEIFTIPASGGTGTPVTDNVAQDRYPDWQPNTAPTITAPKPAPGSTTTDRTPTISAKVSDTQDNLSKANIKLYLDGNRKSFSYDASKDKLTFTSRRLSLGKHTVRVVATDTSNLATSKRWSFTVVK